jgi:hypothetical protein
MKLLAMLTEWTRHTEKKDRSLVRDLLHDLGSCNVLCLQIVAVVN